METATDLHKVSEITRILDTVFLELLDETWLVLRYTRIACVLEMPRTAGDASTVSGLEQSLSLCTLCWRLLDRKTDSSLRCREHTCWDGDTAANQKVSASGCTRKALRVRSAGLPHARNLRSRRLQLYRFFPTQTWLPSGRP